MGWRLSISLSISIALSIAATLSLVASSAVATDSQRLRIVSMNPSLTSILIELGGGENLVAIDDWSARQHPALQQAVELVRHGEDGPLGVLQQVNFQRALVERQPIDVRRHFARDVETIRTICGEIVRLGAAGAPRDDSAYANLGVQMSSPSGLIARWAVEPAGSASGGTLTLRGSQGT